MGLAYHIVEALVREHKYRAIQGEVVLIGRQAVYFTAREILALLREHNIEPALEAAEIEVDRSTTNRGPGTEGKDLLSYGFGAGSIVGSP
jgi:hypothetical protein